MLNELQSPYLNLDEKDFEYKLHHQIIEQW